MRLALDKEANLSTTKLLVTDSDSSFAGRAAVAARPGLARRPLRGGSVAVVVSDLDHAIGFYCATLGLELRLRVGDAWADVRTSGLVIGLLADPSLVGRRGTAATPSVGFEVDDLDEARVRLAARGVRFSDGIDDDGSVRVAHFRDLDGNRLFLCQVVWGPGPHLVVGRRSE